MYVIYDVVELVDTKIKLSWDGLHYLTICIPDTFTDSKV